jgi:hypothetical protein
MHACTNHLRALIMHHISDSIIALITCFTLSTSVFHITCIHNLPLRISDGMEFGMVPADHVHDHAMCVYNRRLAFMTG